MTTFIEVINEKHFKCCLHQDILKVIPMVYFDARIMKCDARIEDEGNALMLLRVMISLSQAPLVFLKVTQQLSFNHRGQVFLSYCSFRRNFINGFLTH